MRAGQLYSRGGWPSPCLLPQAEIILFLVLRGTFIVGLWVVGVSDAQGEGFMWIPGPIAL